MSIVLIIGSQMPEAGAKQRGDGEAVNHEACGELTVHQIQ
jgi:hypothetical protein